MSELNPKPDDKNRSVMIKNGHEHTCDVSEAVMIGMKTWVGSCCIVEPPFRLDKVVYLAETVLEQES